MVDTVSALFLAFGMAGLLGSMVVEYWCINTSGKFNGEESPTKFTMIFRTIWNSFSTVISPDAPSFNNDQMVRMSIAAVMFTVVLLVGFGLMIDNVTLGTTLILIFAAVLVLPCIPFAIQLTVRLYGKIRDIPWSASEATSVMSAQ